MNSFVKEKRYFYDWFHSLRTQLLVLSFLMFFLLSCLISYPIFANIYVAEITTIPDADLEYIAKVGENIYDTKTKTINFANIPNDVRITEFNFVYNTYIIKCQLKRNTKIAPSPHVTLNISEDFKNCNIKVITKVDYYSNIFEILSFSLISACAISALVCFLILFLLLISFLHKLYDKQKLR